MAAIAPNERDVIVWSYPSGKILFQKKLDERVDHIKLNAFRPNLFAVFQGELVSCLFLLCLFSVDLPSIYKIFDQCITLQLNLQQMDASEANKLQNATVCNHGGSTKRGFSKIIKDWRYFPFLYLEMTKSLPPIIFFFLVPRWKSCFLVQFLPCRPTVISFLDDQK